jgi:hypothetical protein
MATVDGDPWMGGPGASQEADPPLLRVWRAAVTTGADAASADATATAWRAYRARSGLSASAATEGDVRAFSRLLSPRRRRSLVHLRCAYFTAYLSGALPVLQVRMPALRGPVCDAVLAQVPASAACLPVAIAGAPPDAAAGLPGQLVLFLLWCEREAIDPLAARPDQLRRYWAFVRSLPAGRGTVRARRSLSAWYAACVEAGLRHDASPVTVRGWHRADPADPMAPLVDEVAAPYASNSRPSMRGRAWSALRRAREQGVDPFDPPPMVADELLAIGGRPYPRLLEAALQRGDPRLGPNGQRLLETIDRSAWRFRLWAAHLREDGFPDPGCAPAPLRDAFLEGARAALSADEHRKLRRRVADAERSARREGRRPALPVSQDRLRGELVLAGLEEAVATGLTTAFARRVPQTRQRWELRVVTRFFEWSRDQAIDPFRPAPADLSAYRRDRGDDLGLGPLRRFLRFVAATQQPDMDGGGARRVSHAGAATTGATATPARMGQPPSAA